MSREKIVKMAERAGFERLFKDVEDWVCFTEEIERFYDMAQAEEREECAKIADKFHTPMGDTVADIISQQIRARGDE